MTDPFCTASNHTDPAVPGNERLCQQRDFLCRDRIQDGQDSYNPVFLMGKNSPQVSSGFAFYIDFYAFYCNLYKVTF